MEGAEDLAGISERAVRAFCAGFDLQYELQRFWAGARYLNSANGELKQLWEVMKAAECTDVEWTHGHEQERARRGVDPV